MARFMITAALSFGLVAGCQMATPDLAALKEPRLSRSTAIAPPGAPKGTCWGRIIEPAVIETRTRQIMVQPAEILADGTVKNSPIYRTETHQEIVKERREIWFETPCEEVMTEEFIASLQRALRVRALYRGIINGQMSAATRAAVRRYQKARGLDTGILTLVSARELGLVVVDAPRSPHSPQK